MYYLLNLIKFKITGKILENGEKYSPEKWAPCSDGWVVEPCFGFYLQRVKNAKEPVRCKWVLLITECVNIAVNDIDARKRVRCKQDQLYFE